MQFCNDQGMAHSQFLRWSEEDRAKALAQMLEAAQRCQMCGTVPWEWEEDRFAYEPVEHTCMGCYRIEMISEDAPARKGTTWRLVPRDKADDRPVRR